MNHMDSQYEENHIIQLLCPILQSLPMCNQLLRGVSRFTSAKIQFTHIPPKSKFTELMLLRKNGMSLKYASYRRRVKHLDWQPSADSGRKPRPTEPDKPED